MRRLFLASILLTAALGGCESFGDHSGGFIADNVSAAFIPLTHDSYYLYRDCGAAVVIAPGIAVTNAHNRDVLGDGVQILGESHDRDLLFFRTDKAATPVFSRPVEGENVVAYGLGARKELREARGFVKYVKWPVAPRCNGCAPQTGFAYLANAGPGFSGGPVVDAASGAILGITFGYLDQDGHRFMFAYSIAQVRNELARIEGKLPTEIE